MEQLFNPFVRNAPFPLNPRNVRKPYDYVFRGYRKCALGTNGLIETVFFYQIGSFQHPQ